MRGVFLDAASLGEDVDLQPVVQQLSEVSIWPQTKPEQVVERIAAAQVVLVNKVHLGEAELAQARHLKLICVLATGMNNIDLEAAARLGISVHNVRGYGTESVAQHSLMLLLALATRLPLYQKSLLAGDWQKSAQFCLMQHKTTQLAGKTLLLVGRGELGQRVAELAQALGMQVMFAARTDDPHAGDASFQALLPQADAVSFHCPLTPATTHLLDAALLAQAKPSLLIVNTARGGIVDEQAALNALRRGQIAGLAMDVLTTEPPVQGHPLLEALDEELNLIMTPHSAWISPEARQNILGLTAKQLAAWQAQNKELD